MTKPAASTGPDVIVIIPAAGEGRRLGGTRKQFRMLGECPLLVQTVKAFDRHPMVRQVIVVAPEGDVESVAGHLSSNGVTAARIVVGGATRQESVGNGLQAVAGEDTIVLVHDAVRPFISKEDISAVIHGIGEHGAAAVAVAVVDTLRSAAGDTFGPTVPRENLFRMLTPQGTTAKALRKAYTYAERHGIEATDEVELLQASGVVVHRVPGSTANIKITSVEDLELARLIWPQWSKELSAVGGGPS